MLNVSLAQIAQEMWSLLPINETAAWKLTTVSQITANMEAVIICA